MVAMRHTPYRAHRRDSLADTQYCAGLIAGTHRLQVMARYNNPLVNELFGSSLLWPQDRLIMLRLNLSTNSVILLAVPIPALSSSPSAGR
jgi:hypothetical protein